MKKLSVLSSLTLSGLILAGCSTTRTPNDFTKEAPIGRDSVTLTESVGLRSEDIFLEAPAGGEYTHEMAEADADDQKIKKEIGAQEIDDELPGTEHGGPFLKKRNTKRMQFWVDYFTNKNRERFQRFINNGEEYRHVIEEIFSAHGLPKELYYVGLIESGYYLGARSHASAVGPWQFIKGTGKRYNLRITSELDERQDLFKATNAAAMYFKDLHNVFSSWELALSAYNAGEYGIIRRIMKHGTRDFYQLSRNKQLPSETINYVPKVLAAMHVIQNARKYGFVIPHKKHRLFDLTELRAIKKNVSLSTIARRLSIDVNLLRKLNPELKQGRTPRYLSGTYYLRVPKSKYAYSLPEAESAPVIPQLEKPEGRKEVNRRTADVREVSTEDNRPQVYEVKRGDTLVSIARKFDLSAGKLAAMNGFKTWRTRVKAGQELRLEREVTTRKVTSHFPKVKILNKPIVYKVRRGDNLTDIARIFDQSVRKLKKANNLRRGKILVGQKIVLPDTKKGIYVVRKGDHLTKVARDLKQPLDAIIKLNRLKRGHIYPGQKIIVNMD